MYGWVSKLESNMMELDKRPMNFWRKNVFELQLLFRNCFYRLFWVKSKIFHRFSIKNDSILEFWYTFDPLRSHIEISRRRKVESKSKKRLSFIRSGLIRKWGVAELAFLYSTLVMRGLFRRNCVRNRSKKGFFGRSCLITTLNRHPNSVLWG